MAESDNEVDRRSLIKTAGGGMVAATVAATMDARSYARILGANERIRLGQLGCRPKGAGHIRMTQMASKQTPVEIVAVCDLWKLAREHRAALVSEVFKLTPASYQYSEDMLASKDIL